MLNNQEKKTSSRPYIEAVQDALKALSLRPEEIRGFEATRPGSVRYETFIDPIDEGKPDIDVPGDIDRPTSSDLEIYISKLMEYVATFLVADRLGKELGTPPLVPPQQNDHLTEYVKRILQLVGHGTGEERETEQKKYYPFPHLQALAVDVPFVDFAGFLIVLLTDYVRWNADDDSVITKAARNEAEVAFDFLTDPGVYIEDEQGIGWTFVSAQNCDDNLAKPLPKHRHVFPTVKAIMAIEHYCHSKDSDAGRVKRARALLPRTLEWLSVLARAEKGMFFASEINAAPFLLDHLYATEALLTLAPQVSEAKPLVLDALNRFLDELDKDDVTVYEFSRQMSHRIELKGSPAYLFYNDRATWATCLIVLAQGVDFLINNAAGAGQIARARKHCNNIALSLLTERQNPTQLWPQDFLQFHWVHSAVEALLSYSIYVPPQEIATSVDDIIQAADLLLRDEKFIRLFRELLIEKIKQVGRAGNRVFDEEEPGPSVSE